MHTNYTQQCQHPCTKTPSSTPEIPLRLENLKGSLPYSQEPGTGPNPNGSGTRCHTPAISSVYVFRLVLCEFLIVPMCSICPAQLICLLFSFFFFYQHYTPLWVLAFSDRPLQSFISIPSSSSLSAHSGRHTHHPAISISAFPMVVSI
jgi:hypothetical protein